jgi:hypothetical protein
LRDKKKRFVTPLKQKKMFRPGCNILRQTAPKRFFPACVTVDTPVTIVPKIIRTKTLGLISIDQEKIIGQTILNGHQKKMARAALCIPFFRP